ncbi:MAG: hypothetical protein NT023_22265 [Armatimonadetes bacterium]|nr:hypothetical protein [Armatimonadota bacterium]
MEDKEVISEAMRLLGSRRTPKKIEASAANIRGVNERRKAEGLTEEHKAKLKAAQLARRAREREAAGVVKIEVDPNTPKRGRGRPPKATAEQATLPTGGADNGA